jgi:hypothetical protein
MIAALLGLWRYGLFAGLLTAAVVWHLADKAKAVDDAVEIIRAEFIVAALAASEANRATEIALNLSIESLRHDYAAHKTRNVAAAAVSAGRLRDLQTALTDSRAADPVPSATTGTTDPTAEIVGECGRALIALDEHAQGLAATASALQRYVTELRLK